MKKFKLDEIDKKEPFKAPQGYFDELPLRMQKRIDAEKKARQGYPPVYGLSLRWSLPVLAALLLLTVGWPWWRGYLPEEANTDPLAEIATADLIYYLEMESVSSEDLVEVVDNVAPQDSLWNDEELNLIPGGELTEDELMLLYDQFSTPEEIL